MTDITNTEANQKEHVELAHATGMPVSAFVSQDAILGQEARGQREVVESTKLPYPTAIADLREYGRGSEVTPEVIAEHDAPFVELGFRFGEPVPGDPLFREATLPEGWYREGTEHSMHSVVRDADGYERVAVFYKAAFYDRRADMHIVAVPKTKAQRAAYLAHQDEVYGRRDEAPFWRALPDRREGPNYVYCYQGQQGVRAAAENGGRAFQDDGRRLELVYAPDGTLVERREFTVEPEPDRGL